MGQTSAQLWPLLASKLKGAAPGRAIPYAEADDREFFELFFDFGDQRDPFFDPTTCRWLRPNHYHSNSATMRKKTFIGSWKAATFDDGLLNLEIDYFGRFAQRLTKRAEVQRVPALALAVWMFKDTTAWGDAADAISQIDSTTQLVSEFKDRFNFDDPDEWEVLFDPDDRVPDIVDPRFVGEPLTRDQISELCTNMTRVTGGIQTLERETPARRTITLADLQVAAEREGLVLPDAFLNRLLAALEVGHVRLIGAPGTGKSTIARMILVQSAGDNFEFAAATGQWTGDEIIGGLVPDPKSANALIFQPGLALRAAEENRWLCIDEINRADIDAAFGEFFSLLSGFDVTTPYRTSNGNSIRLLAERPVGDLNDGEFGVPEDWRMIATMNSWDKLSLNRLSFAFSRRWCSVFVPIPDPDAYRTIIQGFADDLRLGDDAELISAYCRIFSDRTPLTLRSLGLELGPGIARSCMRDVAALIAKGIGRAEAFAYSLCGFLLPQFEGASESHQQIAHALTASLQMLNADAQVIARVNTELMLYTGAEFGT